MVVGDNNMVQQLFRDRGYEIIYTNNMKRVPNLMCLTGGMDINPCLYGEEPLIRTHVHPARDKEDLNAIKRFPNVPKIGICRGAQLLNVLAGGGLWQHVTNHAEDHFVIDLLFTKGERIWCTSSHHQMMRPAPSGIILGISSTKRSEVYLSSNSNLKPPKVEPEVIWYESTNSLCFQPHPEYTRGKGKECKEYFFKLIDYFY